MANVQIRSAYSPHQSVKLVCVGAGRTKQAHKDECDINKILARFQRTGVLDFVEKRSPQFGDVTGVDFQDAMNKVASAREMFMELPAKVRSEFNNDPAEMLDFVADPLNSEEAIKLGLLEKTEKAGVPPAVAERAEAKKAKAAEAAAEPPAAAE